MTGTLSADGPLLDALLGGRTVSVTSSEAVTAIFSLRGSSAAIRKTFELCRADPANTNAAAMVFPARLLAPSAGEEAAIDKPMSCFCCIDGERICE